jgi:hypothetical protein
MRITGLDRDISRFQVVSMLTGTGFTTKESELILRHPVRRKIGIFLILFGVFSLAVVISFLSSVLAQSFHLVQLTVVAAVLFIAFLVIRGNGIRNRMSERFKVDMEDNFAVHELPIQEVLYLSEDDLFVDIPIHEGSKYSGRKWIEMLTEEEDMNLLFIQRGDKKIREKRQQTEMEVGDIVYMYGNKKLLMEKFQLEMAYKDRQVKDENKTKAFV